MEQDNGEAQASLTCQVDVGEALSQGGDVGGERVHRLVGDAPAVAQVQLGQVRNVTHQ